MKKFLLNIIFFSVLLALIFGSISVLQSKYNNKPYHHKKHYEEIYSHNSNANAIILGSSHAVHSIQPSLIQNTDYKWFNFALNGGGPDFFLDWYEQIFRKEYSSPKVCIYAIDWFIFNSSWLYRHLEQDSEYFSFDSFIRLYADEKYDREILQNNRFPFLKYRNQILQSLQLKKGSKNYLSQYYDKGFIPFSLPYQKQRFSTKRKPHVDLEEFEIFKELIQKLRADNVEILFVVTPEFEIGSSFYQAKTFELIDEIVKEHDLTFINFNEKYKNEQINTDVNNFSDWGHLNLEGSTAFMDFLNIELNAYLDKQKLKKE